MNMNCKKNRNYMDELLNIIDKIECLKPEPEVCNVRCPPLGCPRGPCPGMCCAGGVCDPCCVSKMPRCPPPPPPPRCRAPPLCWLKAYAKSVGYPPESCLSPQNSCNRRKSCMSSNQRNHRPPKSSTAICSPPCCPVTSFQCC